MRDLERPPAEHLQSGPTIAQTAHVHRAAVQNDAPDTRTPIPVSNDDDAPIRAVTRVLVLGGNGQVRRVLTVPQHLTARRTDHHEERHSEQILVIRHHAETEPDTA